MAFYSLCFPCFSPFLVLFCSAISLHPSELREGWWVFNSKTQHDTDVHSFSTRFFPQGFLCIDFISSDYILIFWFIKCVMKNGPGHCQNASCSTGGACLRWGGWGRCLQQTEALFAWSTHCLPRAPILHLSVLLLCLSDFKPLKYVQNILKKHNMLSWWHKLHQKINCP